MKQALEPEMVQLLYQILLTVEASPYFAREISYEEKDGEVNGTIGIITVKIED